MLALYIVASCCCVVQQNNSFSGTGTAKAYAAAASPLQRMPSDGFFHDSNLTRYAKGFRMGMQQQQAKPTPKVAMDGRCLWDWTAEDPERPRSSPAPAGAFAKPDPPTSAKPHSLTAGNPGDAWNTRKSVPYNHLGDCGQPQATTTSPFRPRRPQTARLAYREKSGPVVSQRIGQTTFSRPDTRNLAGYQLMPRPNTARPKRHGNTGNSYAEWKKKVRPNLIGQLPKPNLPDYPATIQLTSKAMF